MTCSAIEPAHVAVEAQSPGVVFDFGRAAFDACMVPTAPDGSGVSGAGRRPIQAGVSAGRHVAGAAQPMSPVVALIGATLDALDMMEAPGSLRLLSGYRWYSTGLETVVASMLVCRQHLEILSTIVLAVLVDVMHVFRTRQRAPDDLLHDVSVLIDPPTVTMPYLDLPILLTLWPIQSPTTDRTRCTHNQSSVVVYSTIEGRCRPWQLAI